jgi:hypothetical protein
VSPRRLSSEGLIARTSIQMFPVTLQLLRCSVEARQRVAQNPKYGGPPPASSNATRLGSTVSVRVGPASWEVARPRILGVGPAACQTARQTGPAGACRRFASDARSSGSACIRCNQRRLAPRATSESCT